jgi:hypothetical protein
MDRPDDHRYFEGLAVAHVLGGLDDSEGRVFRSHLLECPTCRARVGELRAIAHDLADVERDERRVRAAQAIDTKRRESEEETDDRAEPVPSPRSARITVIVGLVLIIGLSLWNFTLRGALTVQEARNESLVAAGVISESGQSWRLVREAEGVDGSMKYKGEEFVLTVDGLSPGQLYGLYVQNADGAVAVHYDFQPEDGRLRQIFKLPADAVRVAITNPVDEDGRVTQPGDKPTGERVFEAVKP